MRDELIRRGQALKDDASRVMSMIRKGGNGAVIAAEMGALADKAERFRADAENWILKDGAQNHD